MKIIDWLSSEMVEKCIIKISVDTRIQDIPIDRSLYRCGLPPATEITYEILLQKVADFSSTHHFIEDDSAGTLIDFA